MTYTDGFLVMDSLLTHATELSDVGRRRKPSMRDLFIALVYAGRRMHPWEVLSHAQKSKKVPTIVWNDLEESRMKHDETPSWSQTCNDWLASDDEEENQTTSLKMHVAQGKKPVTWGNKRRKLPSTTMAEIPSHLPALPPRHTWMSTPAYPVQSASAQEPLAFIDLKLSSTRLTEASLRSLIRATDSAAFDSRMSHTKEPQHVSGQGDEPPVKSDGTVKDNTSSTDAAASTTRTRRGRQVSLRVRTTTSPQTAVAVGGANTPVTEETSHMPYGTRSQRTSTTSAIPALSTPSRNTTVNESQNMSPGVFLPWSSTSGALFDSRTPLTPEGGFAYPPTPNNQDHQNTEINLPGVVNYKRTWYKRSSSVSNNTLHSVIKSS